VKENGKVLDVRKDTEYFTGHVKDASSIPLAELENNLSTIEKNEPVLLVLIAK